MKYKKGFMEQIRIEEEFRREQQQIKKKHDINIKDENIVVVEKTNTFKFIVKLLLLLIRFIATTLILVLAALGAVAIIYPEPRAELIYIINSIIEQVIDFIR